MGIGETTPSILETQANILQQLEPEFKMPLEEIKILSRIIVLNNFEEQKNRPDDTMINGMMD